MKRMILKMMLFLLFFVGINWDIMAQIGTETRIKVNVATLPDYAVTTGAIVKLYQNIAGEWVLVQELTTNGNLSYVFMYLIEGIKYKVEVSLDGYSTQSHEIEELHGEVVFYFALSPEKLHLSIFNNELKTPEFRYVFLKQEDEL